MKKSVFLVAIAATALASCSSDDVMQLNSGNEINFSVVADNDSRAATVYCNSNLMKGFNLYAGYNNGGWSTFIEEDFITVSENGKCTQTETRYWPENGELTFFGLVNTPANNFATMISASNYSTEVVWGAETPVVKDFKPSTDVTQQTDLLYAVAAGCTKQAAPVQMNFRHALSQIEFRAKNLNPQLHVVIDAVRVGQTDAQGTYTLPSESTTPNKVDHNADKTVADDSYVKGTWSDVQGKEDYLVKFNSVAVPYDEGKVQDLTISNDGDETNNNSLILIPTMEDGEATTAWNPAAATYDGTYLAVYCTIYNVAGDSYVEGTDVAVLHKGWAVIPVSFKWKQGKKYIYTFNFSKEGNGGYEGGDEIEDKEPSDEPVLTGIELEVTVDDFIRGEEPEQEMDTDNKLTQANIATKILAGGSFVLSEDITLDESLIISKETKIDLNGKTLKGGKEYVAGMTGSEIAALVVDGGATLTLKGEGDVEGSIYGVYAKNGTLNIEGGNYSATTSAVQVASATVNISGGNFSNTNEDKRYTINCIDAYWKDGSAKVNIAGGTYEGFNPADNAAEGAGTNFVAEGYKSVETSAGVWEVVSAQVSTADELVTSIAQGGEVILADDITLGATVTIPAGVDVVLDLNGKTLTNKVDNAKTDVIIVNEGATLTINGEGNVTAVSGNDGYAIISKGVLTINGGTYRSGLDAKNDGNCTIYAKGNGKVYITGGDFSTTEEDTTTHIINKADGDRATTVIEISGGTFTNFNPGDNRAEGAGTNFLAAGYKSVETAEGSNVWNVVAE